MNRSSGERHDRAGRNGVVGGGSGYGGGRNVKRSRGRYDDQGGFGRSSFNKDKPSEYDRPLSDAAQAPSSGRGRAMTMPAWMASKSSAKPAATGVEERRDTGNYSQRSERSGDFGDALSNPPAAGPVGYRIGNFVVQFDSSRNLPYYYNVKSKTSQWEPPPRPPPPPSSLPPRIPDEWTAVFDQRSGRQYFWNENTDEVRWEL